MTDNSQFMCGHNKYRVRLHMPGYGIDYDETFESYQEMTRHTNALRQTHRYMTFSLDYVCTVCGKTGRF